MSVESNPFEMKIITLCNIKCDKKGTLNESLNKNDESVNGSEQEQFIHLKDLCAVVQGST